MQESAISVENWENISMTFISVLRVLGEKKMFIGFLAKRRHPVSSLLAPELVNFSIQTKGFTHFIRTHSLPRFSFSGYTYKVWLPKEGKDQLRGGVNKWQV